MPLSFSLERPPLFCKERISFLANEAVELSPKEARPPRSLPSPGSRAWSPDEETPSSGHSQPASPPPQRLCCSAEGRGCDRRFGTCGNRQEVTVAFLRLRGFREEWWRLGPCAAGHPLPVCA